MNQAPLTSRASIFRLATMSPKKKLQTTVGCSSRPQSTTFERLTIETAMPAKRLRTNQPSRAFHAPAIPSLRRAIHIGPPAA